METRETPVVEHIAGRWATVTEASCVRPGKESTNCTVCGLEMTREIPALGHEVGRWVTREEATCVTPGSEIGSCLRCGQDITREIPAKGHTWSWGYCADCEVEQGSN